MVTVKITTLCSSGHPVGHNFSVKLNWKLGYLTRFFVFFSGIFVSQQTFVTFDLFVMEKRNFGLPDSDDDMMIFQVLFFGQFPKLV